MGNFKEKLLEALEDQEVIVKLQDILKKETSNGIEESATSMEYSKMDIIALKTALEEEQVKREEITKKLGFVQNERDALNHKLQAEQQKQENLFQQNQQLLMEIEKLKTEQIQMKEINRYVEQKSQAENSELREKLKQSQKKYEGQITISDYYIKTYEGLEQSFRQYQQLEDTIKEDIRRVICAKDSISFLACGSQWSNIEALWEHISFHIYDYKKEQLEQLIAIEDYFFEVYEGIRDNYIRLSVNEGEEFDEEYHTRTSDSQVSGKITEVILRGYKGKTNGKVKKTIVRI